MRKTTAVLLLLIATTATAHGGRISGIAAVVNDDVITTADAEREARPALQDAEKKGAVGDDARKGLLKEAVTRLVDKKLVEQKIRELNIRIPEEELRMAIEDVKKQNHLTQEALVSALAAQGLSFDQYKAQLREQMERLRLVSQEVRAKVVVSEQEMREDYDQNAAKMREEESFRARQIFFRLPKSPTPEDLKNAMTQAVEVQQQARAGGDFAKLAEKYSQDPSAKDGGSLGVFRKNDMIPELQEALETLKPGEVSDLVQTPAGFHIVKLEERIPGRQKSFEEVRAEIEDRLYRKKSEERFNQWVSDLKKEAVIDVKI
jgi:peptidyl-prolyl cis-trans isomerase SurA